MFSFFLDILACTTLQELSPLNLAAGFFFLFLSVKLQRNYSVIFFSFKVTHLTVAQISSCQHVTDVCFLHVLFPGNASRPLHGLRGRFEA